ncbi:MAG: nuclear transport factor 2 family protein [Bacteroidota bacterium]|nr:nuclear transport factor 2 family protein [Bacteroidota bacterium]
MDNSAIINKFYNSFAAGDAEAMVECYAPDIIFEDPAFGILIGDDAKNMWRMLIERSNGGLKINHSNVKSNATSGSAEWIADYPFASTGRSVVNKISATFEFKDGKIIEHTDHFDLWKWSRQALGLKGILLGWTSIFKKSLHKQTTSLLIKYTNQKNQH